MIAREDLFARYTHKNVLVTGGKGFLGRSVCATLNAYGAHVIAPSSKEYDLTIPHEAEKMFQSAGRIDYLFHLAGYISGIQGNDSSPIDHLVNNMRIMMNVLEQTKGMDVSIVAAGSVCAYPSDTKIPFKETDLWYGAPEETNAPYGVAKRAMLMMLWSLHKEYGVRYAYLISANLYGPGDHFDSARSHVIPALIRKFMIAKDEGAPNVVVWGDGSATRDFLYIRDAADAYVRAGLVADDRRAMMMNIGSEMETRISWLAELIKRTTKYQGDIVYDSDKLTGQRRRLLDCEWAHGAMDWYARTNILEGIEKTVEWYGEFEHESSRNY